MNIESISCVFFSPTGTTKKISRSIAEGIDAGVNPEMIDCTMFSSRTGEPFCFGSQLVILSAPVYYGRVPQDAAAFYSRLKAEKTPVILVAVYGNRAFDDALKELYDIAVEADFVPVAGAAFIGEHSYSSSDHPIAPGRPDKEDLERARKLGSAVREKLESLDSIDDMPPITVPGNFPYIEARMLEMLKQARKSIPLTPETDPEKCTTCGECVEACPNGAISEDATETDRSKCILCFACVKACPEGAREMKEPNFRASIKELQGMCRKRKEPEWFL